METTNRFYDFYLSRPQVRSIAIHLLFLILALGTLVAQSSTGASSYADQNNPLGPQGPDKPGDIWNLDPYTGMVHIKIVLPTTPTGGRGPKIPFILQYNSGSTISLSSPTPLTSVVNSGNVSNTTWQYTWTSQSTSRSTSPAPAGPWTVTYGPSIFINEETGSYSSPGEGGTGTPGTTVQCSFYGPYLYGDPNGQIHDLNLAITLQTNRGGQAPACPMPAPNTTTGGTTDSSVIAASITGFMPSGPNGLGPGSPGVMGAILDPSGTSMGGKVEDSNGNYALYDANIWKDSEGRTIATSPFNIGSSTLLTGTYTVGTSNFSGTSSTYSLQVSQVTPTWNFILQHPTTSEVAVINTPSAGYSVVTNFGSVDLVSQIALPNSISYFSYDPVYGTISKITFPQGGYVRFVWGVRAIGASSQGQTSVVSAESTLVATDAYISDGIHGENRWHYSYANMNEGTGQLVTTETAPDGTRTTYTSSPFQYSNLFGNTISTYQETLRQIQDSAGTMIRAIATSYGTGPNGELGLPSQIVTTDFDAGLQKQVTYQYDKYDNVIEKSESQFYSCSTAIACTNAPPLLRTTNTSYLWAQNSSYVSAHIVNKPTQITVSDGSGNILSQTQFCYDDFPLSGSTGIVNHDDQNYPVSRQTGRGNLTTEKQCVSFSSGACAQSLITTYKYDIAGQLISRTDPKGNTTYYSNSNAYDDGYLTLVTDTLGHQTTHAYNFATGLLTSTTDPNGQTTTYSYSDSLDRLTDVYGPPMPQNGNQQAHTHYAYTDGTNSTITTTNPIGVTSVSVMDGIGRLTQTQLTSDSQVDYTNTLYDGEGRVYQQSNPTRCSSSPGSMPSSCSESTWGITTFNYDALDRKTLQVQPDGSRLQWCYDGVASSGQTNCLANKSSKTIDPWVDYSDEIGNHWQRISDALARLTAVMEPNPSDVPSVETDYLYDARNDLTGVTQGAESRSFVYDDLSRMTSATNPESGTTSYTYDANSNLQTKTDARGISITYSYDALNRLIGKTYSDGTYPVSYSYDVSSGPSPMNTIGRLTDEKTTVQGYITNEHAIDEYDAMGRVLSERQCFMGGCGIATNYTLTHSYDVAGNIILSNNGMPSTNAVTLGYSYDGAGHLQSVSSTLNDAEHPEVLFQATEYSAVGLTNAEYALPGVSGTPAYSQTLTYDDRMRLTGETDTATSTTTGMPYSYAASYDGVGNVTAMNDSLMGAWSYTTDTLNRLSSATPGAGAPGGYAGMYLCMNYDVYGNRTQSSWQATACNPGSDPATATYNTANRVTWTSVNSAVNGFQYDASGDVTNDNANLYEYDAEGRQTGVLDPTTGALTGYVYDAEGGRAMKVVVNGFGTPQATTTVENEYLLGPNGEQVTVLGTNAAWLWTNVYAGSKQLATYDSAGTHFALTDWLGSKRLELSVTAASTVTVAEQCTSLPFGDGLNCIGSDVNQLHFTGKERDTESGLDYFGARYYTSSMGRFMSPDWAEKPEAVPYSQLDNPQSLNLYGYVNNNPLSKADKDGHDPNDVYKLLGGAELVAPEATPFILGAAAAVAIYQNRDAISQGAQSLATSVTSLFSKSDSSTPAPAAPVGATAVPAASPATPLPSGLVGTQDDKSGPQGNRHNSGPLDPAHGGTGDAGKDFGTLTGGKSGPAPAGSTYPPGTQVGGNGVAARPARGNSGPRIDVPANGDKPHETLHYPKDPQ